MVNGRNEHSVSRNILVAVDRAGIDLFCRHPEAGRVRVRLGAKRALGLCVSDFVYPFMRIGYAFRDRAADPSPMQALAGWMCGGIAVIVLFAIGRIVLSRIVDDN